VLDITHQVPPGDIRRGAAVLAVTAPQLPPAVHLAVVDPGVGTRRRAVALAAGESLLVGPDNGLLVPAAEALGGIRGAVHLSTQLHSPPIGAASASATFDGRDLFAPAAALLATGTALARAGQPVDPGSLVRLPERVLRLGDGVCWTEVVDVDRFGNCALSMAAADLDRIGASRGSVVTAELPDGSLAELTFLRTFADAGQQEPLIYLDSTGRPAIAVNCGSAARRLHLAEGDVVVLRCAPLAAR
jgi:S-adenosylmethionine hydrolase